MTNAQERIGWVGFNRAAAVCTAGGNTSDTLQTMVAHAKDWAAMTGIPQRDEAVFAIAYEVGDFSSEKHLEELVKGVAETFSIMELSSQERKVIFGHQGMNLHLDVLYRHLRSTGFEVEEMKTPDCPIAVVRSNKPSALVA